MYRDWNLLLPFILTLLFGTGTSFLPFEVLAASDTGHTYRSNARRIAIIGAGAAGSSTAYHVQKFSADSGIDFNITVFEKSSFVGGRSTTVNVYDNPLEPVELGASIFVDINTILKNASEAFGLKTKESMETDEPEVLGIWDGQHFVYTQKDSGWKYWDIAKLLWKYGLAPIRTQNLMKSTVGKFLKLYTAPFFPFRSLSDRALDLDLTSVTSLTGAQLLEANDIGAPFTTDIIQASTRVNYGQNLGLIHGLETMVCMAIEGAMQITGGNWQIFDGMLKASNATVSLNSTVNAISKHEGRYMITFSSQDSNTGRISNMEELFDTVVLAGPLQYSKIDIEKDLLTHVPDEIPYVTLHVTLFASPFKMSPIFFNLSPGEEVPTSVLTTLPPHEVPTDPEDGVGTPGFFSISTLRTVINPRSNEKEYIYKIFSPKKITPAFMSGLLGVPVPSNLTAIALDTGAALSWYYPYVWHSYPYEYPRVTFDEIELARGFYYTSAIESFISTMETSALMGMNVAQLIVDDYLEVLDNLRDPAGFPSQMSFSEKEDGVRIGEL